MFDWFNPYDFQNGLLTEAIAMAVELVLIVGVLRWFKRRDDNRRLARYRARTRKLLSRSLTETDNLLKEAVGTLTTYRKQLPALDSTDSRLPPPTATALVVSKIKLAHELLNRDY